MVGRVTNLIVDGEPLAGNLISPAPAGTTVTIEATIESAQPAPGTRNGTGEAAPAPVA
jgi:hypothetical protein